MRSIRFFPAEEPANCLQLPNDPANSCRLHKECSFPTKRLWVGLWLGAAVSMGQPCDIALRKDRPKAAKYPPDLDSSLDVDTIG